MDFEGFLQRKTNTVLSHSYVQPKKKVTPVNKIKRKQTHRYREQMSGYQWGKGRGGGQDIGD